VGCMGIISQWKSLFTLPVIGILSPAPNDWRWLDLARLEGRSLSFNCPFGTWFLEMAFNVNLLLKCGSLNGKACQGLCIVKNTDPINVVVHNTNNLAVLLYILTLRNALQIILAVVLS
jgi:hypothetical protein